MEIIKEVSHKKKKGNMMNSIESLHIYNETKLDKQTNDKGAVKQNIVIDRIIKKTQVEGILRCSPVSNIDCIVTNEYAR